MNASVGAGTEKRLNRNSFMVKSINKYSTTFYTECVLYRDAERIFHTGRPVLDTRCTHRTSSCCFRLRTGGCYRSPVLFVFLPLDYLAAEEDENTGKSQVLRSACTYMMENNPAADRLQEMTEKPREVFRLVKPDGIARRKQQSSWGQASRM